MRPFPVNSQAHAEFVKRVYVASITSTQACTDVPPVGHRATDCPDKPPSICKNCGEEGHEVSLLLPV